MPPDLANLAQLHGARVVRLIRDLAERRVYELRLNDRTVFLKQFRTPDPAQATARAAARLAQAGADFGAARDDGVAGIVLVLPEAGVLVTEAAPGLALAQILQGLDADAQDGGERARLLRRTGAWLGALAKASRSEGRFGPRYWIDAAQARIEARIEARIGAASGDWLDRDLLRQTLAQMRREAPALRGMRVERALLHGDLTPDNLFYDASSDRMTAIDMPPYGEIAVARDVARLLVWLESRRADPAEGQINGSINGISRADHDAVLQGCLMGADQAPILRLMIADIAVSYYLDSARQPIRRAALARLLRGWRQAASTSASAAS